MISVLGLICLAGKLSLDVLS